jgi:hypothetical protein
MYCLRLEITMHVKSQTCTAIQCINFKHHSPRRGFEPTNFRYKRGDADRAARLRAGFHCQDYFSEQFSQ